jgi:hypothetical protein
MTTDITDPDYESDEDYLARRAEKYGMQGLPEKRSPFIEGEIPPARTISRRTAMVAIGEVLYAAMMPDGIIKIGHTTNLLHRFYNFPQAELLAIKAGNRDDEKALHQTLTAHRHHGHEYYNPTPEVMAVVNDWRTTLGLESVA